MKYGNFLGKLLALGLIAIALWQYQQVAEERTALALDYEAQTAEILAYNEKILQSIAAAAQKDDGSESGTQETEIEESSTEGIYVDGTYEGTAAGFGGDITVSVSIEADVITAIDVLSAADEDPAYYTQAEALLTDILESQSTEVDVVSGATFSSNGLIKATAQALSKAVR